LDKQTTKTGLSPRILASRCLSYFISCCPWQHRRKDKCCLSDAKSTCSRWTYETNATELLVPRLDRQRNLSALCIQVSRPGSRKVYLLLLLTISRSISDVIMLACCDPLSCRSNFEKDKESGRYLADMQAWGACCALELALACLPEASCWSAVLSSISLL